MNINCVMANLLDLRVLEKMYCPPEEKRALLPLVEQLAGLADCARRDGILVLESRLDTLQPPLLQKGLRLAVDGTDPDYIRQILFYYSICGGAKGVALLRNFVIMEGVLSIQRGDNAFMVRDSVLALFGDDFIDEADRYFKGEVRMTNAKKTVQDFLAEIADRPAGAAFAPLETDFETMSPNSILAVLRYVERDTLAVAFTQAGGKAVARLFDRMTSRAGEMVVEDMKRFDGTPEGAVERAVAEIKKVVDRLKQSGEVVVP